LIAGEVIFESPNALAAENLERQRIVEYKRPLEQLVRCPVQSRALRGSAWLARFKRDGAQGAKWPQPECR